MHLIPIIIGTLLLVLTLSAAWSLVTARPVTPWRIDGENPFDINRLLNTVMGRHSDGSRHQFTEEVPLGRHACETMSYCHHERLRCMCGSERVVGFAVEEVR